MLAAGVLSIRQPSVAVPTTNHLGGGEWLPEVPSKVSYKGWMGVNQTEMVTRISQTRPHKKLPPRVRWKLQKCVGPSSSWNIKSEASSKKEGRETGQGRRRGGVRSWRSCHIQNFNLILQIMKGHCKALSKETRGVPIAYLRVLGTHHCPVLGNKGPLGPLPHKIIWIQITTSLKIRKTKAFKLKLAS